MTTKKPHTGSTTDNKRLTEADQDLLVDNPLHSPAEIKSYLKPAESMDRIAPAFIAFLKAHPEIAASGKIDAAQIESELAAASQLDGPASRAYNLYRRGYENAMEKRSDVVRAIYKVNRLVQNSDDQELAAEFSDVTEWVAKTHSHNSGAQAADPVSPVPVASSVKGT